ncbi:MAG TPA: hypothetical protein VGM90_35440 [Kofleriaceae bacterium]
MAESSEVGAPIPKDQIDPDLIKLARTRPKIGVITCAGIVVLSFLFAHRLNGDRKFSSSDTPTKASVADVTSGKFATDTFIAVQAEPLRAHAIRAKSNAIGVGLRVVPARGSSDKLWLVISGDDWQQPSDGTYQGRLQKLADLPFVDAVTTFAASHPRPVFAKIPDVRAAFSTGKLTTVTGDSAAIADADKVSFDVTDPNSALIICTFNERFPDAKAWSDGLVAAGITDIQLAKVPTGADATQQVRYSAQLPNAVAELPKKLADATLWAARVEPLTVHHDTTWGALKLSPAGTIKVGTDAIPDAEIDLAGFYVDKGIPDGAYALIAGDRPADYWYVLPIMILLLLLGTLFAWVLVRAVKRDFIEPAPAS